MTTPNTLCPCGSEQEYEACCKPFHLGCQPENALQLMRSRYSAYALNIPDYIVATTHPASPQYSENRFSWKRNITDFSQRFSFQKLEILDFKEKETLATVTFTSYIFQDGRNGTYTERSYFEKIKGQWLYRSGQQARGRATGLISAPGELKILPLAYYGDAVLRKKAEPVIEITPEIRKLAEEMVETMNVCNGDGLAAPQVHHSIRLFVVRTHKEDADGELVPDEVLVIINPKLSSPSNQLVKESEGCLSIPTTRGYVERPLEITVEYTNLEGHLVEGRFSGWDARAFMHENDHLNGVLFIDRLEKEGRSKVNSRLSALEKRINEANA